MTNAPTPRSSPRCSVIIATLDRLESLRIVLDCLDRQTAAATEVLIAAAGDPAPLERMLANRQPGATPIRVITSPDKSAARQRNLAAASAIGEVLAFLDDDIEFGPDLFAQALACFCGEENSWPSAVSPRHLGGDTTPPGLLIRCYYRLLAGYAHLDYGGCLFGPGMNRLPGFPPSVPEMLPVQWLPSTCLFVRATLFRHLRFPDFSGYSFGEDVHLTARLAREAPLYFLRDAAIIHHSLPSEFKADRARLIAGKLHNMGRIAREVQGLAGLSLWWRWHLHRLFLLSSLMARRPAGWTDEARGILQARL